MGWSCGVNNEGRKVGYSVEATCDQGGCSKEIDRGLAYACGAMHDGGDRGCGGYFCYAHLEYVVLREEPFEMSEQVCPACAERIEADIAQKSEKNAEIGLEASPRAGSGCGNAKVGQNGPIPAPSAMKTAAGPTKAPDGRAGKNPPRSGDPDR